jgi:hypothetical protein
LKPLGYLDDVAKQKELKVGNYAENTMATPMVTDIDAIESEGAVRFRFIGEKGAENLDRYEEATTRLDNLNVAREMEAAEKDAKTIKMATGWERGADGKWRYEVEDNITFDRDGNISFAKRHPKVYEEYKRYKELLHKRNALLMEGGELSAAELDEYTELGVVFGGDTRMNNSSMLEDYVDAPGLFEAYPKLRETRFEWTDNPAMKGQYDSVHNIVRLNSKLSEEEMKRTLVHEIQHAIQGVEGFATGTNPRDAELYLKKDLPEEHEKAYEIVNRYGFTLEEARQWIKNPSSALIYEDEPLKALIADVDAGKVNWDDVAKWSIGGYNAYRRAQGEVEARNAASRLGMTLEERRASLASETEDVAREDQIFLRDAVDGAIAAEENNESLTKGKAFESGQPTQKGASLTNVSAKVDENFERTKRLNDIVSYIDEYGEMGGHEFLHEVVNAMTLEDSVSTHKSRYAKLKNGITLRLSTHYGKAKNFRNRKDYYKNYGLVVKLDKQTFVPDKDVDYLEYVYFPDMLTAERQKEIAEGLKSFLESGNYESLPTPDKVNESKRKKSARNRTAEIVDEGPFSDEEREQAIIEESAKLGVKVRVMTLWYSTTKIYKQ